MTIQAQKTACQSSIPSTGHINACTAHVLHGFLLLCHFSPASADMQLRHKSVMCKAGTATRHYRRTRFNITAFMRTVVRIQAGSVDCRKHKGNKKESVL
ncbi:hypothetical protein U9Z87_23640 [Escherichia coli]